MKILLVQIRRVGDTLMATPLLRALRQAHPAATIHVFVEPPCAEVLAHNPNVDALIHSPGGASLRVVPGLRRARYDVVIDALGTPASARLTRLTGAPVRIGPASHWRRVFYTHRVPHLVGGEYSASYKLRLGASLGVDTSDTRLDVFPSPADESVAARAWESLALAPGAIPVAFSPVSRRPDKVWPPDRYASVCDNWRERAGFTFVAVAGPGEHHYVDRIVERAARKDAFAVLPAPLPFGALTPFLRRCAFYFGQDNGIRHLAIAAGLPTAGIFAHPDPRNWTPPGDERHLTAGGNGHAASATIESVQQMLSRLTSLPACVNWQAGTETTGTRCSGLRRTPTRTGDGRTTPGQTR